MGGLLASHLWGARGSLGVSCWREKGKASGAVRTRGPSQEVGCPGWWPELNYSCLVK